MNTNNGEANTEIAEVEKVVIVDGDTPEIIKQKVDEYTAKVDERNAQLFARTKKAEGFELKDGKWVKPDTTKTNTEVKTTDTSKDGLTTDDVFTLVKANVPQEDVNDVKEYAKLKGITIAEALNSNVVKTILADKAEQRKVAEGTNTNAGARGSGKLSDGELLANAEKGNLPDSTEDMQRLITLRKKK